MTLQTVGQKTDFTVAYDDSLISAQPAANQAQSKANLIANCNYLLDQVETAFTTTTGWFGTDVTKFGTGNRQQVNLDKPDGSGASNNGYGNPTHPINVDGQSQNSTASAGPIVSALWMAEWSEVLMSLTSNWNRGDSSGEGLSNYCGIEIFQAGHYDYYNSSSFVEDWLNGGQAWAYNNNKYVTSPNAARSDWITQPFTGVTTSAGDEIAGDGDQVSYGCALAFIYYLTVQLSFSINDVISKYSGNLASAYNALTGDPGNPFPFFLALISNVYPSSATAAIPGPVTDKPLPDGAPVVLGQQQRL